MIRIGCGGNSVISVVSNTFRNIVNIISGISASGGSIEIIVSVLNERAPISLRLSRIRTVGGWGEWSTMCPLFVTCLGNTL